PPVGEQLARAAAATAGEPRAALPPDLPAARLRLHAVLSGLLGVEAALLALVVQVFCVSTLAAATVGGLCLTVLAIVTAGLQHRRPVGTALRVVTWVSAGSVLSGWVLAYLFFWIAALQQRVITPGFSMENQMDRMALRLFREWVAEGAPEGMQVALGIGAVVCGFLALAGFAVYAGAPPRRVLPEAVSPPGPGAPPEGP
ncbi:MAG: hypothetical protein JXR77_07150, partial [Lentisphaeria bacterium]|nr:hypothetical protein [Lentisphaeria bacterium]